jgi:hypothetical protein
MQNVDTELEKIKAGVTCSADCGCVKSGFITKCRVRGDGLVECLDKRKMCSFSFPYGESYFCKCPVLNYIYKGPF